MKKIIFVCLFLMFFISKTFAHPLDISSTTLSFSKNIVTATTYFHTYEIEYLLNKNNIYFKNVYDYYVHKDLITNYLSQNIKLNSQSWVCKIQNIELKEDEEYKVLTSWVEINYNFECKQNIDSWSVNITFFPNFPLQTNQLAIYNLNDKKNAFALFDSIILNNELQTYNFNLAEVDAKCATDTDWDWLSDDLEKMYKTDPNKIDTDWDFYTDYEEINWSFSALDKNYWPKQESRYEIPKEVLDKINDTKKSKKDCEKFLQTQDNIKKWNWILSNWFWNEYFAKTLKNISEYVNNSSKNWVFYILLTVVFLGFIHAAWPGHSKSLLVGYILDEKKWFFDGLYYITIFTFTHLIDIIVLFLFTKILTNMYDISNYMLYIQRFSILILFLFSLYLIYKFFKKSDEKIVETKPKKDLKWSLFIWFVSGLAPCSFGWSIFLLLFSMWNFGLIIPMILALWTWIWICLFLVLLITLTLRKRVFEKVKNFSKYSMFASSSFLLVVSLFLMINLY